MSALAFLDLPLFVQAQYKPETVATVYIRYSTRPKRALMLVVLKNGWRYLWLSQKYAYGWRLYKVAEKCKVPKGGM